MAKPKTGRWAEMRERIISTPELREQYERTRRTIASTRQVLMEIDGERQRAGLSKAELARRMGMTPSVVRRLFSSRSSNPTLGTVISMAGALGMEIELRPAGDAPVDEALKRRSHRSQRAIQVPLEPWDVAVFQRHRDDDPNEACPAERSFKEIPDSVAVDLSIIRNVP